MERESCCKGACVASKAAGNKSTAARSSLQRGQIAGKLVLLTTFSSKWRIRHHPPSSEVLDRVKAFALAVVYFGFAYSAFGFARGAGKFTGKQNSAMSARLMQTGAGTIALIAGGVIIVAVGGYHVYKGASRNFLDDLKGNSSDLVRRLGMVGYIAKGLVIAGAGVLVVVAASRSEPNTATGLDGALKTLGAQPYGAALLIAAGLGIITYGLYSFAMARYTKM